MTKPSRRSINPIGRWVLISGCDSGFGFHSSLNLIEHGFGVISACLTQDGRDKLVKASGNNPNLHAFQCDVTNTQQVNELVESVQEITDNELWAVINNAGIVVTGNIDYLELQDFRDVMEVNYFAAVNLIIKCIPMLKTSRGRIINISSSCGFLAMPSNAPYNSSKFGFRGLSDTIRRDLRSWGINVSIIEPGTMKTPFIESYYSLMLEKLKKAPEDIQEQYGINSMEQHCLKASKRMKKIAENPKKVIGDIYHAVSSKRPKYQYRPGFWAKFILPSLNKLPYRSSDKALAQTGSVLPQSIKNRGKVKIEIYQSYDASVEELWTKWLDYAWIQNAGLKMRIKIEDKGDKYGKGCTRFVPFYKNWGIREGITSVDYPKKLYYKVMNPGWTTFPVNVHKGTVRFISNNNKNNDDKNHSYIKWAVEFTPKPIFRLFIKGFLQSMIKKYLKRLKIYLEQQ